jgi:hypothetical protein
MEHPTNEHALNRKERQYIDFITHGDDFYKIEIFRAAKKWYTKALELNLHNEEVQKMIDDCTAKIKSETRTISIIALVAVLLTMGIVLIN